MRPTRAVAEAPTGLPLGPGTMTWQVNTEPAVFLGSSRALLLQVAHPLVGAGVQAHSTYTEHPWGRLWATLETMLTLAFGTPAASARQRRRLRRAHAGVRGVTAEGEPYDAHDPALARWVWATLVDTSLTVYERAVAPLTPAQRERYYREQKLVGHAAGVPDAWCPPTLAAFDAYLADMLNERVHATPAAHQVAATIFTLPWPPLLRRPLGRLNELTAAGLLPADLRQALGIAWDPIRQRRFERLLAGSRCLATVTPAALRRLPVRGVVAVGQRRRRVSR